MKDIHVPPFYVGQRVVYIDKSNWVHKHNNHYTVESNGKCLSCGEWHTSTIETELPYSNPNIKCHCTFCKGIVEIGGNYFATNSKSFVPVQETFQLISCQKVMENELIGVN